MTSVSAVTLLVSVAAALACGQRSEANAAQTQALLAQRQAEITQRLAAAGRDQKQTEPVAMWVLPAELREISGLALTADGRVLTHDDEIGRVYVIDPKRGVVLKRFTLGDGPRGDFEGITVADSSIYLLASNGILLEFKEGADGASVPYSIHDTKLGHECTFESVAFEASSASLLLPCKVVGKKSLRDQLVIYRWHVRKTDSPRLSMFTVPLTRVIGTNDWKTFHPSDMTVDPTTGNWVLISSHEKGLVEVTPSGQVLRSGPLPGKHHQPEGVTITRDGILIVSDEATKTPATITLYRWRS